MIADTEIVVLALFILIIFLLLMIAWHEDSTLPLFPAGIVTQLFAFDSWTVTADLNIALALSMVGIVILLIPIASALRGRPSA
jgi:hypothetical protein